MPPTSYLSPSELASIKASFPMGSTQFAASVGELITIVSAHAVPPGDHKTRDELQGTEVVCEVVVSEGEWVDLSTGPKRSKGRLMDARLAGGT